MSDRPDPFMVIRVSTLPDFADTAPVMVDSQTRAVFAAACARVRSRQGYGQFDENECLFEILNCYVDELTTNDPETGTV